MSRIGAGSQALHFSYEKAGLALHDQPIPWNAEAVLVEASVRLPPACPRRKSDLQVRVRAGAFIAPERMRHDDGEHLFRLFFRLPAPGRFLVSELFYKTRLL